MVKKKTKQKWPSIYLDEHAGFLHASFQPMRVIEISKTKFRGKDEREYISNALYRINGIFVTSDFEFANEIADQHKIKHAGIVFISRKMSKEDKIFSANVIAGYIRGGFEDDKFRWRSTIIYPGYDGIRTQYKGNDVLAVSWAWLYQ